MSRDLDVYMSPIPTIPYDQVGPFGPCDHEHVQAVLVKHLHLVFLYLAVLDTVVSNPCLKQSSGS